MRFPLSFVLAFFLFPLLPACEKEKHPEAEQLAALMDEEFKIYREAKQDCDSAVARLEAFYADPGRLERAAGAVTEIIHKDFSKDEDYRAESIKIIKPSFMELGSVKFDFNSKCKVDPDLLELLKLKAGQEIKQAVDAKDIGAVSRLYQMNNDLREYIQTGLYVYDPEVEMRMANLRRHRARKAASAKLSGGLKMMDRLMNAADALIPPGNKEAKGQMQGMKEAWDMQKAIMKSIAEKRR